MNKKADSTFGIIVVLALLGLGFYFFIYDNGSHNPFTNTKLSNFKCDINWTTSDSCGGLYFRDDINFTVTNRVGYSLREPFDSSILVCQFTEPCIDVINRFTSSKKNDLGDTLQSTVSNENGVYHLQTTIIYHENGASTTMEKGYYKCNGNYILSMMDKLKFQELLSC